MNASAKGLALMSIFLSMVISGCGGGSVAGRGAGAAGPVDSVMAFSLTVYPIVRANCTGCHTERGPQSPQFAHSDVTTAHSNILPKINLVSPASSRIVIKVAGTHECWTSCDADSQEFARAIDRWKTMLGGAAPRVSSLKSDPLLFSSATGGARFDANAIALYDFTEGTGTVAKDSSGVSPAMDLTLTDVDWVAGGGIRINGLNGSAIAGQQESQKLFDMIAAPGASNEFTIEAWLVPGNLTQSGPSRIISYSINTTNRNFMMGQVVGEYGFRNRSSATDTNGNPILNTANATVQTELQHVVMTFDQTNGRKIYINGQVNVDADPQGPGDLSSWVQSNIVDGYTFIIGNELTLNRLWQGQVLFAAIHNVALSPAQVSQNFAVGAGTAKVLSFDVSQYLGTNTGSVQFQVSEFDNYSYLFAKPTFVGPVNAPFQIKNIQIGINGAIPSTGQTFKNLDVSVTADGQELSRLGAVLAKLLGADIDEIFLTFEVLGDNTDIIAELNPSPPVLTFDETPQIDLGLRLFEQINANMAAITGVDPNLAIVKIVYTEIQQQLPSLPNLDGFSSANQVGITKLALEYCDAMVEDGILRNNFFGIDPANPAFDFGAGVNAAFRADPVNPDVEINLIADKLIANMVGSNLSSQPSAAAIKAPLLTLMNNLIDGDLTLGSARTRSIVKVSCAAVLASAAVTIR